MKRYLSHLQTLLLLFLCFVINSCKKEKDPEVIMEEPIFTITGELNGKPFQLNAGDSGYEMVADYSYDSLASVFEFKGSFQKNNCPSCPGALGFTIRNYRTTQKGEPISVDSGLNKNYYTLNLMNPQPTIFNLNFLSQTNGAVQKQKWFFGDGYTDTTANPQHNYMHPGTYTVCYIALFNNGCSDTLFNTFSFGIEGSVVTGNFSPLIFGDSVTLKNYSSGTFPLNYFWEFGDGVTSTLEEPYHIYSSTGVFTITLTVRDAENHSSKFSRKVFILPTSACMASMQFPQLTAIPNLLELATAGITYIDNQGVTFSTYNDPGNNSGHFRILSNEDYAPNEKGNPVKKIHFESNSTLYDSTQSKFVVLHITDGVFAVAYH